MQQISDSDLKKALITFHLNEIAWFEEEAARNPHHFSLRFRLRMRLLLWKMKIKGIFSTTDQEHRAHQELKPSEPSPARGHISLRKMVLVFLAIFLAVIGFCTAAIAVQNAYRLVEKVFPKYSDIRFENPVSQEHTEFVLYEITEVPEGFVKDEESSFYNAATNEAATVYWKGKTSIVLDQSYADKAKKRLNTEGATLVPMRIGERDGYHLVNRGVEMFFWTEGEYCLMVYGEVSESTLIELVESVKPQS